MDTFHGVKAIVLPAVGAALEQREIPEPNRSSGEIIDVTACGVCHSDLHVVDGEFPSPLPLVLGHEVTGVHADRGPVMVYAPGGCGACAECADGLEMICGRSTEAGLFTDGGYAERMWVPDRRYLAPLVGLDPIASAPLACGGLTAFRAVQHVIDELRSRPAPRVAVIGAGGLGQFAIRYLRLLTDAHVIAIDTAADKRARALSIGAHAACAPGDTIDQVDGVIDFIGAETTLALGLDAVRKRGVVVVVGLAGGRASFGFGAVPHEARLLTSVWGSRGQLDELLDLARREPSVVQPVEVLPLTDAQQAHDRLRAGLVKGRIVLTVN